MLDQRSQSLVVAVATLLFFAGVAWEHLSAVVPAWVRTVVGISAAVLALVALFALLNLK